MQHCNASTSSMSSHISVSKMTRTGELAGCATAGATNAMNRRSCQCHSGRHLDIRSPPIILNRIAALICCCSSLMPFPVPVAVFGSNIHMGEKSHRSNLVRTPQSRSVPTNTVPFAMMGINCTFHSFGVFRDQSSKELQRLWIDGIKDWMGRFEPVKIALRVHSHPAPRRWRPCPRCC